jgi:NAD(P)-dependent dehydrogenase (short-subunit alcohol dehydrogenase family)
MIATSGAKPVAASRFEETTMKDLRGRTAFITGGASGIGLGMARVFAREGMRIALADVEAGALDSAAATLAGAGAEVLPLVVDVSDRAALEDAARRTEERFGHVHLVCNNAGVGAGGPLDQCTYDDWDWVMAVNLGGVINGVQTFVRRIKAHGQGGHFVNTASMAGLMASGGLGVYCTTKYAVVGLSECLRLDLEPYGIGVSVLCPGFVSTNISESARNRPERFAKTELVPDPVRRQMSVAMIKAGMDPVAVGEAVRDAVIANELWVLTHPDLKPFVEERSKSILASFKREPDPAEVAATRARSAALRAARMQQTR